MQIIDNIGLPYLCAHLNTRANTHTHARAHIHTHTDTLMYIQLYKIICKYMSQKGRTLKSRQQSASVTHTILFIHRPIYNIYYILYICQYIFIMYTIIFT